jgi:tetratricopeptide (TPR) repeat protein
MLALPASAEAVEERLCDLPPFDQILLDETNKNALLDVELLDLPGRRVPPNPVGDLTVRLLADTSRPYDISWTSIRKVLLFEDNLMREAQRFTSEGNFDDAFDYYARLLRDYPAMPGLNDAVCDYLRRNALALQQSGEYDRALAVLMSLYDRQPGALGLVDAVDTVCGKIIAEQQSSVPPLKNAIDKGKEGPPAPRRMLAVLVADALP